jgi:hypothetical protein
VHHRRLRLNSHAASRHTLELADILLRRDGAVASYRGQDQDEGKAWHIKLKFDVQVAAALNDQHCVDLCAPDVRRNQMGRGGFPLLGMPVRDAFGVGIGGLSTWSVLFIAARARIGLGWKPMTGFSLDPSTPELTQKSAAASMTDTGAKQHRRSFTIRSTWMTTASLALLTMACLRFTLCC